MKTFDYLNDFTADDLLGALYVAGGDAALIECEEDAEDFCNDLHKADYFRAHTPENSDEFWVLAEALDLTEDNKPSVIYTANNGVELIFCLADNWE